MEAQPLCSTTEGNHASMSKNQFRILTIVTVLLTLAAWTVDGLIPNPEVDSVNYTIFSATTGADGMTESSLGFTIYTVFALFTFLLAIVGILFFKPWARTLFVLSLFLSIPFYFTNGLYVSSGTAELMYDLSMMGYGTLLALMYLSQLRQHFEH